MKRITLLIAIVLFFGPALSAQRQTPRPDSSDILKQLLAEPAPTPRNEKTQNAQVKQRPPTFFEADNTPPDDAPIEDLLEYWSHWTYPGSKHEPSATVRQRLFDACLAAPQQLPGLVNLIPQNETVKAKVKELYDRELNDQQLGTWWQEQIRNWLLFNSNYFLNELIALANEIKEDHKDGSVENSDALVALAKQEWTSAEPLIQRLVASGPTRAGALALSLSYRHAIAEGDTGSEERYRRNLRAIVSNINLLAQARSEAIDALSLTQWSGRDEWYLSLFHDNTLLDHSPSPLATLFNSDPEEWIPIMTRMVESKDLTVRSAAATCLISVQKQSMRKDALRPLLPWLSNPGWAIDRSGRSKLMQIMMSVDMPESVTGLIWAVENDESESNFTGGYAALSLAKYKDPRAVPALKKALVKAKDDLHRQFIIESLLASQGLTEEEQLEALEAYASKLITPEDRALVNRYRSAREEPLPIPVSIGRQLSQWPTVPDSLMQAVLMRAESLKKENPPLAQALLEVAHRWQGRQIELDMIRRIENGSADAKIVVQALERRSTMRENLRAELQALTAIDGLPQGVGIVLLDDPSMAQQV